MHDISGTLCQIVVQIGPDSSEISFLIWESFCAKLSECQNYTILFY